MLLDVGIVQKVLDAKQDLPIPTEQSASPSWTRQPGRPSRRDRHCLLLQLVLINFMVSLEAHLKQSLSWKQFSGQYLVVGPGESCHLGFQAAIGQALMFKTSINISSEVTRTRQTQSRHSERNAS